MKTHSAASGIAEAILLLGGLVLISFAGVWPVHKAVDRLRGILGGLLAGLVGLIAGMFVGLISITIVFSIISP